MIIQHDTYMANRAYIDYACIKNSRSIGYKAPDLTDMIENVIFNDPATIVFWIDGTKTVVKCEKEKFDPEKGLSMACAKKLFGNRGHYYEAFKKWIPEEFWDDER